MAGGRRGASSGARVLGTLIDLACMLPWLGVVAAAGALLFVTGVTRGVDDATGNLVGFITLIVPITVAAAGFDQSARHATPGKRRLRLRVVSESGGPGFTRALVRNVIKYALPWELAHTAVFALVGSTTAPPLWVAVVLAAAYGIPIVSLVLLIATGRPLHDRVARTSVTGAL
ncbi:MAG: RDD family protein [Actinomycetota bacterium]|nr:RDD family protein [Actinomycetota bacterium]